MQTCHRRDIQRHSEPVSDFYIFSPKVGSGKKATLTQRPWPIMNTINRDSVWVWMQDAARQCVSSPVDAAWCCIHGRFSFQPLCIIQRQLVYIVDSFTDRHLEVNVILCIHLNTKETEQIQILHHNPCFRETFEIPLKSQGLFLATAASSTSRRSHFFLWHIPLELSVSLSLTGLMSCRRRGHPSLLLLLIYAKS